MADRPDPATSKEQWLSVCDIIDKADIPLSIDCIRDHPNLSKEIFDLYLKVIYERPRPS